MPDRSSYFKNHNSAAKNVVRPGFGAALLTALAVAALGIVVTTAPDRSARRSWSARGSPPYTDVAEFVPIEYFWMYPAFLMALGLVVLAACIYYYASAGQRVFGLVALSFAAISATAHAANYFVQFAVVQPSLLRGEAGGPVRRRCSGGKGAFGAGNTNRTSWGQAPLATHLDSDPGITIVPNILLTGILSIIVWSAVYPGNLPEQDRLLRSWPSLLIWPHHQSGWCDR